LDKKLAYFLSVYIKNLLIFYLFRKKTCLFFVYLEKKLELCGMKMA